MKGSISEFELGVLRARMQGAARAKAGRGELRIGVPVGYVWHRDYGLGLDPDLRLQEAIRIVFERFRQVGSARHALLSLTADGLHFPRPSDGKRMTSLDWTPIRYRNVIALLKNPCLSGRPRLRQKREARGRDLWPRPQDLRLRAEPFEAWDVLIRDHHEGTIAWAEFERNQRTLAANAYGRSGGGKSGRGGRALLAGMARLRPLRAGPRRGLHRPVFPGRPVCRCDRPNLERGLPRCLTFGGARADAAIAAEVLRVVEPMAIEAAREAERMRAQSDAERRQMAGLDLRQARLTRRRWPSAATPPATPTFA